MKTGMSLSQLVHTAENHFQSRKDYQVPVNHLAICNPDSLAISGVGEFGITQVTHGQLATYTKIPKLYYDRIQTTHPELYTQTMNTFLAEKRDEVRIIRTLGDRARAMVSDRHRQLDNYEALKATLPVLKELGAKVLSANISETKMHLKVIFPEINGLVPGSKFDDDKLYFGFGMSNSEVGMGAYNMEAFNWRKICANGMYGESLMKKYHVGKGANDIASAMELWSDGTKEMTDKAFWAQVTDTISGIMTRERMQEYLDSYGQATGKLLTNPKKAVELISDKYRMTEDQESSVLKHLIDGGDLSVWGLANAVTRTAEDQDDYDTATSFEKMGGEIITLSSLEWKSA